MFAKDRLKENTVDEDFAFTNCLASGKKMCCFLFNANALNLLFLLPDRAILGRRHVRTIGVRAYLEFITLLFIFIIPTLLTFCRCFATMAGVAKLVAVKTSFGTNRSTFTFKYPTLFSFVMSGRLNVRNINHNMPTT